MHAWEAIQEALNLIEDNLHEDIEIERLAAAAGLSPFYFQRLFSRLVGRPVREYIKLRRLARACDPLKQGMRIVDVALDVGFQSHETFTRAFKEAYGMTPEQYRDGPVWLNQFDKPDLLWGYVLVDEGVALISDGLVLEINRKTLETPITFMGVLGHVPIQGQMPLGKDTGVDMPGSIWERFHREKHRIARIPGGRELGVAYLGDAPEGSFTYFAGAEVTDETADPCFATWQLPARAYAVCGFEAENFEELVTVAINKAVTYCGMWAAKHGLTVDAYAPELYFDSSPEARYMELWMPVG